MCVNVLSAIAGRVSLSNSNCCRLLLFINKFRWVCGISLVNRMPTIICMLCFYVFFSFIISLRVRLQYNCVRRKFPIGMCFSIESRAKENIFMYVNALFIWMVSWFVSWLVVVCHSARGKKRCTKVMYKMKFTTYMQICDSLDILFSSRQRTSLIQLVGYKRR